MRVGLIVDMIDDQKRSGVGNYIYNLLTEMFKISQDIEWTVIHHKKMNDGLFDHIDELIIPEINIPLGGVLRKIIEMPLKLKAKDFDIIHETYQIGPFSFPERYKKIITIHDLTPLILPESHPIVSKIRHKIALPVMTKTADKIIADSNSTKKDLINYFNVPEEKIKVILLAADEKFKRLDKEEIKEVKQKYNLNYPFILYVGTLEPRKDIPSLIRAFYKLKKKIINYKLVITGKKGWKYKEIFETIDKLNLQNDVVFTGYVPDEDLPALYNAADLFVYPSLYEGFGLPPLEAMACGTPVITSNTSSLPEVVGDAGIMIDPSDVDGLADAMYEVLSNEGVREDMAKRGLERAKRFSWERCARETLATYEEVYNER